MKKFNIEQLYILCGGVEELHLSILEESICERVVKSHRVYYLIIICSILQMYTVWWYTNNAPNWNILIPMTLQYMPCSAHGHIKCPAQSSELSVRALLFLTRLCSDFVDGPWSGPVSSETFTEPLGLTAVCWTLPEREKVGDDTLKREKLAENTTVLPRRLWGASGRRSGEFWRRLRGKDGSRAEALSGGGVCVAAVERRSRREKHERTCLFSSSHLIVKLWVEKTPDSPDRAECVGRFVLCNVQKTRTTRITSATAANTLKSSRKWNDLTVNSNECSCFFFFFIAGLNNSSWNDQPWTKGGLSAPTLKPNPAGCIYCSHSLVFIRPWAHSSSWGPCLSWWRRRSSSFRCTSHWRSWQRSLSSMECFSVRSGWLMAGTLPPCHPGIYNASLPCFKTISTWG